MPHEYRTRPDDQPRCRAHPLATANETCAGCGAPACDVCATFTPSGIACVRCEPSLRRRRRRQLAAATFAVAAVLGAVIRFRGMHADAALPAPPVTPTELLRLSAELEGCNDRKIVEIERLLLASGDRAAALARAQRYEASCPASPALLYQVAMDAGDAELAISQATRLVEADPTRASAWGARARAHGLVGHLELAALDYRQALALQRGDFKYCEEAASTLERLDRRCEAALTLADLLRTNYLVPHDEKATLLERARKLWANPACAEHAGSGSASFVKSNGWRVEVTLAVAQGSASPKGTFVFDESFHHPLQVKRASATRLGLGLTEATLTIPMVWGMERAIVAAEQTVRIQRATVQHVLVAVVNDLPVPEDVDGVIGLDFVRRFHQEWSEPGRLDLTALRSWNELSREGPLDDLDDLNKNMERQFAEGAEQAARREEQQELDP